MIEGKIISSNEFVPSIIVSSADMYNGPAHIKAVKINCFGSEIELPAPLIPELIEVLKGYISYADTVNAIETGRRVGWAKYF